LTPGGAVSYRWGRQVNREPRGCLLVVAIKGRGVLWFWREDGMRAKAQVLVLSLLVSAAFAAPVKHPGAGPLVTVDGGRLRGEMRGSAAVFEGIPFAAPPVGALRWREPQPVEAWKGVRDATRPGSACVQDSAGLSIFFAPIAAAYGVSSASPSASWAVNPSEDCLYLNVWTPEWPVRSALPVMVWIHGGSNMSGSGSQPSYDGASLASRGVIVVTINYRLGVMGFFAHPELTAESPHHSSSNYGILDQVAALKWVKQNIAAFGGAPGNVTVFGESAGAIDSGMLLASPLTSGLFRRVISESGPPFGLGPIHTLAEVEKLGVAIGKAAPGTATSDLERLRKLPATEVVKIAADVLKSQTQFKGLDTRSTIVDGWVMPEAPAKIFATGKMQKADLLIGLNGRELSALRIVAAEIAKKQGTEQKNAAAEGIRTLADDAKPLYGGWTNPAVAYYIGQILLHKEAGVDKATNEMLLACPIGALGTLVTAAGQHSYIYQFNRAIPGKGADTLGAFHSLEVPFVFHAFDDPAWNWLPFTQTDRNLSQVIQNYWTNFAKTGNPNGAGVPNWQAWTNGAEPYMEFDKSGTAVPKTDFSPPFCHLAPERVKAQLTSD
jgi:para-nitrobenzyl esterase